MLGFFILGNGRVTLLWELTTAADNETAALITVNVNTSAIEGIEHYDECIARASEMFTVMSAGAIATGFLCLLLLPVAATALKASAALCRREWAPTPWVRPAFIDRDSEDWWNNPWQNKYWSCC